MAPVTRRQSMRVEKKGVEADGENQEQRSSVAIGRVAKAAVERRGKVVASRYMSSARNKNTVEESASRQSRKDSLAHLPSIQPRVSSLAATSRKESLAANRRASTMVAATPRRQEKEKGEEETVVSERSNSSDVYSTYIQWQLIEARAQMEFEAAKEAAMLELSQLAIEAQNAKKEQHKAQRKHKLMAELDGLTRWLASNRQELVDMGQQVSRVSGPYTTLSGGLAHTACAMPIRNVHYGDGETLEREMRGFVGSVEQSFGKEDSSVRDAMDVAEKLNRLYRAQRQESELASECSRIRASLAHTTALAIGRSIDEQGLKVIAR
ncbi:hypothetical protein EV175_000174 [Coemansia sp. RSA 1933]|nr:hypothetical protein EV175_000174 [Coemansia sp. RSA 1933]